MDATESTQTGDGKVPFVFPKWVNYVPILAQVVLGGVGSLALFALYFWGAPSHWYVGYAPVQPVPYSHKRHAGDLGIDCRYCHIAVEKGPHAMVPPAETCMNCHANVATRDPQTGLYVKDSPLIQPLRDSFTNGTPIKWVRAHKVADFAYFDHSRHVAKGVGCVTCHGRVDQMDVVRVEQPLSMVWCLDCHRNPAPNLRPRDQITNMAWTPPDAHMGEKLAQEYRVNAPQSCSGCHR